MAIFKIEEIGASVRFGGMRLAGVKVERDYQELEMHTSPRGLE